ncbi:uroporphyrinogen-III C-methyltransferase [Corticibacter populi]|uniref:uroporphyrinogen-III C-methyltransferase n=1 Tax=Corticibacter populi TaxID=1550736 RepID=A0A3M6QKL1_9BURK|nr:uroporphyrinogen-III C-methyltransferase [Corticibacter populi]RMX03616.1 uroporphyrinogen-III C-methyltransferase [Corticibacter populi]
MDAGTLPPSRRAHAPTADPAGIQQPGRCILVGAGPGDPDLLTLKAVKAMGRATVLLVDDLVGDAVLAHAAPDARVIHVGKRGGCKSTPQAFIEKLMVQQARAGETVVRLKGGDPLIFGRSGEELEALRAAGIEVEVINGITSGLQAATALGVPLTHREHAHGVVMVTGHAAPGQREIDWAQLAQTAHAAQLTLVIYMGVKCAARIQAGLLQGLPAQTPVAVVQSASLPAQQRLISTLERLCTDMQVHGLGSPSIIVVGDVLRASAMLQQYGYASVPTELSESAESTESAGSSHVPAASRQGQFQFG